MKMHPSKFSLVVLRKIVLMFVIMLAYRMKMNPSKFALVVLRKIVQILSSGIKEDSPHVCNHIWIYSRYYNPSVVQVEKFVPHGAQGSGPSKSNQM